MNAKSTRNKNKLYILCMISLFSSALIHPGMTSGLTYVFSEDFSDTNLDGWDLRWEGWNGWNLTSFDEHSFEFTDGYIKSGGEEYNTWAWNLALHEINMSYGVWEIDANYPIHREATKFDFYLYLSDNYFGGIDAVDEYNYRWTALKRNGTLISVSQARIDVDTEKTGNTGLTNEIPLRNAAAADVWTHYAFVTTPDKFFVVVDNMLVANFTYDDEVAVYKTLALTSNIGTNVKFDNIKISLDYEEFLDTVEEEIIPSSSNSNGGGDNNQSESDDFLNSNVSISVFGLILIGVLTLRAKRKSFN